MTTELKGDKRLALTMDLAARDLDDMSDAATSSGAQLVSTARGKAPRLTGALANSLTADTDVSSVQVSSGLDYAGRTHYGWAAVGQQAQPFLTDALAELEKPIVDRYQRQVDKALDKVKGA